MFNQKFSLGLVSDFLIELQEPTEAFLPPKDFILDHRT
jgi:hypothetical protein